MNYSNINVMPKLAITMCILVVIFVFSSCKPYMEIGEPCGFYSELVAILSDNYEEWATQAQTISPATKGVATIHVDGRTYAVLVLKFTSDNLPILSISTNDGYPRSWLGESGYFYTPSGELLTFGGNYKLEQMTDNIYCYWKEKDESTSRDK